MTAFIPITKGNHDVYSCMVHCKREILIIHKITSVEKRENFFLNCTWQMCKWLTHCRMNGHLANKLDVIYVYIVQQVNYLLMLAWFVCVSDIKLTLPLETVYLYIYIYLWMPAIWILPSGGMFTQIKVHVESAPHFTKLHSSYSSLSLQI